MILSYVARKDYTRGVYDTTRDEEILYHTSLDGPMFDQYYNKVMWLINDLTIETPVEVWIKQVKCGCVAMQNFQDHHDVKSKGERCKIQEVEALKKLHYCHEHTFPFGNIYHYNSNDRPGVGKV